MKYSTIKLLELINAAVIIIAFGIAMTLRFPAQSTSWMITLIVILIILVFIRLLPILNDLLIQWVVLF